MTEPESSERFEPRAAGAMASMFDDVSGRYALLNRLMTLGRDRAWRRALARLVPAGARAVLDLCTGDGASLAGLRRPGRLVLGVDVSLRMLAHAADAEGSGGWAPRLVCADAFRLPLRDRSLDAVTVAFGLRNLRPRPDALAEIARVIAPGGTLGILEATAPAPGLLAPFHRYYLSRVVPCLGRLSDDPSAYRYLAESILEFGDGGGLENELTLAGFSVGTRRGFLAGAVRLWSATRNGPRGEKPSGLDTFVQVAGSDAKRPGTMAHGPRSVDEETRLWNAAQAVVSAALSAALVWGLVAYAKLSHDLRLETWQRAGGWVLLIAGTLFAIVRTAGYVLRFREPRRKD